MRHRLRAVALGAVLLLGLSGCPVTDDYYVAASDAAGKSAGGSAAAAGAGGSAAQASAGNLAAGGDDASEGGAPATLAAGGMPAEACVPETERCNGYDDDCDSLLDEMACGVQGTLGCFGFTLTERGDHGYMLCSGSNKRDFENAERACEAQDMRLAWIESQPENAGLSGKLDALGVTEVLFGATDEGKEGDWYWDGGNMFWKGDADGDSVDAAFEAWADSTPNNMNNEDCIVLYPESATWGDRSCSANYAYLCEEREPFE